MSELIEDLFHNYENCFRENCREMAEVLSQSKSERIRSLMWCGQPLMPICKDPGVYLDAIRGQKLIYKSGHGFFSPYIPKNFRGASEQRGCKWFVPGLKSAPYLVPESELPKMMESKYRSIKEEYLEVSQALVLHPDTEEVISRGNWDTFILAGPQGKHLFIESNLLASCSSLIAHKDFCEPFGFCMFSAMGPHTAMIPHVGSTNLRTRCHLGISIPENPKDCVLHVCGEVHHWVEGKVLTFDDSYQHFAENNSASRRVVFNVDIWHPSITMEERNTLSSDIFRRFASIRLD